MSDLKSQLKLSIPSFYLPYSGSKRKIRDENVLEIKHTDEAPLYII